MTGSASGRSLAVALVVSLGVASGCDRGSGPASGTPKTAEAKTAEAKADAPAEAKTVDEAKATAKAGAEAAESATGLAASVQEEVDAARAQEVLPEAKPPVLAPGAAKLADVGAVTLPQAAFDEIFALKVKKYADRGREVPDSARRRYRRSIVERLVHHERLRQRALALGVEADPVELKERTEQQKRGIRDWAKHLERRGETEASLRAMAVAELREQAILAAGGKLEPSRADIEADYEKIRANWKSDKPRARASHILVRIPEEEDMPDEGVDAIIAKARAEADRIYALVKAPGADFEALAREHSAGPSAVKGGDVGIFTADRMAEPFSKAVFSMKPGEISEVVKTKFGFHIIKVTGHWPPGELPLEALEDQIRNRLWQRALHEQRRVLKEELATLYPVVHHMLTEEELRESKRPRRSSSRSSGEGKSHSH